MEGPAGAGPVFCTAPQERVPPIFAAPQERDPPIFAAPQERDPPMLSVDIQRDSAFDIGLADGIVEIASTVCDVGEMA